MVVKRGDVEKLTVEGVADSQQHIGCEVFVGSESKHDDRR